MSSNETCFKGFLRKFKNCLEISLSILSGAIFIIANIYYIKDTFYFWSDYVTLSYSYLFLFLIIFHSILPNKFPNIIKENFGIITNCGGKGILLIIISLFFIKEELKYEKLIYFILLLSGIILIILEILLPIKQEKKRPKIDVGKKKNVMKLHEIEPVSIEEKLRKNIK